MFKRKTILATLIVISAAFELSAQDYQWSPTFRPDGGIDIPFPPLDFVPPSGSPVTPTPDGKGKFAIGVWYKFDVNYGIFRTETRTLHVTWVVSNGNGCQKQYFGRSRYHNKKFDLVTGALISESVIDPGPYGPVSGPTGVITGIFDSNPWRYFTEGSEAFNFYYGSLSCPSDQGVDNLLSSFTCPKPEGGESAGLSTINNISRTYIHDVLDYSIGGAAPGCNSCSTSESSIGFLPQLQLKRLHRYDQFAQRSSFGPGVFSNLDISLNLSGNSVEYWNPANPNALDLKYSAAEGMFLDTRWSSVKGLRLFDFAGASTSNFSQARIATLWNHDGSYYTFEIFRLEPAGTANFCGRLKSICDRNNNAITLNYINADAQTSDAALNYDRTQLWRYSSVQDAYGKSANFTWTRKNGYWVTSTITLPNASTISYEYALNGLIGLNKITFPDGSVSTFDTQYMPIEGQQAVIFDDAAAETIHRRKRVNFSTAMLSHSWVPNQSPMYLPQPSNRVRKVENGSGELSYQNWIKGVGETSQIAYVYEGGGANQAGGRMRKLEISNGVILKSSLAKTFTIGNDPGSINSWELLSEYTYDANQRTTSEKDSLGRRTEYTRDSVTGAILHENVYDAANTLISTESTTYNTFSQPLTLTDRLNRVSKYEYDANGNMLKKYAAFGTADQSLWEWTFNTKGQPLTSKDANLNVTNYVYDTAGFLTTITDPADVALGTRAVKSFTYDTTGRLSTASESVTDTTTRTTVYGYDTRNRRTSITYHDTSAEYFVYGNGSGGSGNANLLIQHIDRNNRSTVFQYDATGRKTRSYVVGTGNPPIEDEQLFTYLPGTDVVVESTVRGEKTTRTFDYRRRPITVAVKPNTATTLTTTMAYDAYNRLVQETDPFNRKTFYFYDVEDRLARTVRETVSNANLTLATAATVVRNFTDAAEWSIEDTVYDLEGQVTKRIDPMGIVDTYSYDLQGRLKSTTRAAAKRDANNVETAITNPKIATKTEYTYDAQGNTISVKHPRSFDPAEGANFITQSTYTGRNLLKSRTEAFGRPEAATQAFTYTLDRKLQDVTDGRGSIWSQIWKQCCGRLAAKVDPTLANNTRPLTFFNYDYVGNLTHTATLRDIASLPSCCSPDPVDADTYSETTTRYDVLNRPIAQTRWFAPLGQVNENAVPIAGDVGYPAANGSTTRWVYDDNMTDGVGLDLTYSAKLTGLNLGAGCDGSAVETTNPTGQKTLVVYDGLGRVIRSLDASGNATTTAYDTAVAKSYSTTSKLLIRTTVTNPLNQTSNSFADALGRVHVTSHITSSETKYRYDINGNRTWVRDPDNVGMNCIFDELNRDIQCTDTAATPAVTKREYDAHGNVTKEIDARNKNTLHVYDARDRRKSTTDRISGVTVFAYDGNNNLTQITDSELKVTGYAYDPRNLLSEETFPGHALPANNEKRSYTYDAVKRLNSRTDQANVLTGYVYDLAGRMTRRQYPDNLDDVFTYDAAGRVLTGNSLRYTNLVTRTYDAAGRLNTETQGIGGQNYTLTYAYDVLNRNSTVTYPNAKSVIRNWGGTGLPSSVQYDGITVRSYVSYTTANRSLRSTNSGNGSHTDRTYNSDGTMATIISSTSNALNHTYAYDANKRKTGITDAGIPSNNQTFGYDDEDRLTSFTRSNGDSQGWNLSLVGDWNTFTKNGTPETRTHNAVHEVTQVGAAALAYDVKGNLTQNTNGHVYTWDQENRLKTATGTGLTASYAYDAFGRRVSKTVNGTVTVFVSDGLQEIAEYIGGMAPGSPSRVYVYSGQYIDEVVCMYVGATRYNYVQDGQYSVAAVYLSNAVTERYKYDPYGKVTILAPDGVTVRATSAIGNAITYTGRRLDAETGLYYFRTRYYSADLGRFLNRTPWSKKQKSVASTSFLPQLLLDENQQWGNIFTSVLKTSPGNYIQQRFSMYDFMKSSPANHVEPFSAVAIPWLIEAAAATGAGAAIWELGAAISGAGYIYAGGEAAGGAGYFESQQDGLNEAYRVQQQAEAERRAFDNAMSDYREALNNNGKERKCKDCEGKWVTARGGTNKWAERHNKFVEKIQGRPGDYFLKNPNIPGKAGECYFDGMIGKTLFEAKTGHQWMNLDIEEIINNPHLLDRFNERRAQIARCSRIAATCGFKYHVYTDNELARDGFRKHLYKDTYYKK